MEFLLFLLLFIGVNLLIFLILRGIDWERNNNRRASDTSSQLSSTKKATQQTINPLTLEAASNENQSARLLTKQEEEQLRSCFPWEVYYLQDINYRGEAILCRGKLRTVSEKAYEHITNNIKRYFGNRFLIIFQESLQGEPFFALVPNTKNRQEFTEKYNELNKPVLAIGLAFITLFTTMMVGAIFAGWELEQILSNLYLLSQGLPYSLSLMAILACHEFSHYFTATYYNIKATIPYFIPFPPSPNITFLGTVGAFIQIKSPMPNRKALFDVSMAGPIGGFVVTVPLLIWGLSLSEVVSSSEESALWNVESFDPRSSLLMTVFSKIALGEEFLSGTAIELHPIAIAGYIGVIVTALNLMPVGQLDGGHIVHAVYGQRTAIIVGQISKVLISLLTLRLALKEEIFLLWVILLLSLIPVLDEPALNDVSELDNVRDLLGFLSLVLLLTILLPTPPTLIDLLKI